MLDSLAAATAERQLKRTYKMLKSDNKTFIFKVRAFLLLNNHYFQFRGFRRKREVCKSLDMTVTLFS